MLTKNEKAVASEIGRNLLKEGMVWGDELEEYARTNAKGLVRFKSDEHYLEFENHLLHIVEREISREILVTVNDKKIKFTNVKSAANAIRVSENFLYTHLRGKNKCSIIKNETNVIIERIRPKLNLI